MSLMCEASSQSNFDDWFVCFNELLPGEVHTQLLDIIADGAAETYVERSRHVRGMNTGKPGQF